MRNLKKFLALMLAMVMAMSLMITANATSTAESFADGSGITPEFAEAVDVLSGMRVFSGDNGNFKPAANITRAEMAAVLYRLVSGDVTDAQAGLYANYAPFKDVTADKWYAGYVGYCWNAGLIKGRDSANTVFDPTGNVTGYEALAMLLRAIGYDKNNEFTGPNWQVNVSSQSRDLGILRDVNTTQYGGTLHLAARRDVIASLTFNAAARVPTVTFNGTTYNPYVGVPVTGGLRAHRDLLPRYGLQQVCGRARHRRRRHHQRGAPVQPHSGLEVLRPDPGHRHRRGQPGHRRVRHPHELLPECQPQQLSRHGRVCLRPGGQWL